ncbi:MAG: hypothetical protein IJX23_05705 [Clostridia bacterium]|nr:hypothetical protein [Clostridia bacterium]
MSAFLRSFTAKRIVFKRTLMLQKTVLFDGRLMPHQNEQDVGNAVCATALAIYDICMQLAHQKTCL